MANELDNMGHNNDNSDFSIWHSPGHQLAEVLLGFIDRDTKDSDKKDEKK